MLDASFSLQLPPGHRFKARDGGEKKKQQLLRENAVVTDYI